MSAAETAGPAARAYAARGSGVHSVPVEEAIAWIRAQVAGEAPTDASPVVWLDIAKPGPEEEALLRDRIGFHPLAVEDCLRGRQRPKLDRYPGYYFLVLYVASINPDRARMALNELHVFFGERYLVTVHDHRVREVGEVVAHWRAAPERLRDVGALAHRLLDVIVDDYFPVLEHFADRTEALEGGVFQATSAPGVSQILLLRHELVIFRRVVAPQREVLSSLVRRDLPFLRPELVPYFQDVYDHILRVTEEIDAQRELLSALLDAVMSTAGNQLNQTLRMMTAWSIILMSMALVAGIYGMNFGRMPELQWRWGYPFALAVMAALGLGLVTYFRRRDWL